MGVRMFKILEVDSYHKWNFWFIIQYTFHRSGSKKFRENEVEWAGKAETTGTKTIHWWEMISMRWAAQLSRWLLSPGNIFQMGQ